MTADNTTDQAYDRIVCGVLLDATKTLPQLRARTRISVCEEARRRWEGPGTSDAELMAAFESAIERLVERGFAKVGGPSQKRVQLNHQGKEHAAQLLKKS